MRKNINCSVDWDLHKQCQDKRINVSELLDNAMKTRLAQTEIKVERGNKCEFCGKEGIPETRETINQSKDGLTWLYPDEKWICNNCLMHESREVLKSA